MHSARQVLRDIHIAFESPDVFYLDRSEQLELKL